MQEQKRLQLDGGAESYIPRLQRCLAAFQAERRLANRKKADRPFLHDPTRLARKVAGLSDTIFPRDHVQALSPFGYDLESFQGLVGDGRCWGCHQKEASVIGGLCGARKLGVILGQTITVVGVVDKCRLGGCNTVSSALARASAKAAADTIIHRGKTFPMTMLETKSVRQGRLGTTLCEADTGVCGALQGCLPLALS